MNTTIVKFEDLELSVIEDKNHEWLLDTALVAKGYDVTPEAIRSQKSRRSDELIENKHFITVANCNGGEPITFWTKRGVVRLGFYVRSKIAKKFRDWAEDLIVNQKPATNDVIVFVEGAARILNMNDNSKLQMLQKAADIYGFDRALLPAYTQSNGVLVPLSKLLEGTAFSARKANPILESKGVLEKKWRASSRGVQVYFWNISDKYRCLGENQVSPNNPKETQPLYYECKKNDFY